MCGRFSLATDQEMLQHQFDFILNDEILNRYNIAPSQNVLVIGSNGKERVGTMMKWGLVPPWSKDTKIAHKMINARSETIDEKISFKKPLQRKRCLILSDGFYEWKKSGTEKQPYRFKMKNNLPFAFAGLWERWDKGDNPLFTCTIITTKANKLTEDVHDRMPVILPSDAHNLWLDRDFHDMNQLKSLLIPYEEDEMEKYPVPNVVNSPQNDSVECIERLNSL